MMVTVGLTPGEFKFNDVVTVEGKRRVITAVTVCSAFPVSSHLISRSDGVLCVHNDTVFTVRRSKKGVK